MVMQNATPERSMAQRMEALGRANEIRGSRAQLKRDLKAPCLVNKAFDIIENPTEDFLTMKLFDLLMAIPKYGRVKVNRVLTQCRIAPSKTLGGLTDRQRQEILEKTRGW